MEEWKDEASVSYEDGPGYRVGEASRTEGRRKSAWPGRAGHLGVEVTSLDL